MHVDFQAPPSPQAPTRYLLGGLWPLANVEPYIVECIPDSEDGFASSKWRTEPSPASWGGFLGEKPQRVVTHLQEGKKRRSERYGKQHGRFSIQVSRCSASIHCCRNHKNSCFELGILINWQTTVRLCIWQCPRGYVSIFPFSSHPQVFNRQYASLAEYPARRYYVDFYQLHDSIYVLKLQLRRDS